MLSHKQVEEYILSMPNAKLDYPFDDKTSAYKVKDKMFAIIADNSSPLRLSLKCDPLLSNVLREKYDEVMPGYHLNKKHWNTIILSGQLEWQEIQDLIKLSYDLVSKN